VLIGMNAQRTAGDLFWPAPWFAGQIQVPFAGVNAGDQYHEHRENEDHEGCNDDQKREYGVHLNFLLLKQESYQVL
jgi:hypothetical protein